MLRVVGDARYGDRMERAFYNAAPGAVNRSFSGHVYYQSPNFARNQAIYKGIDPGRWRDAYWHEPPCCTGNQARFLPNFVHHMWWGGGDNRSLYAAAFGPSRVNVTLDRAHVTIEEKTMYPFAEDISFVVSVFAASASESRSGGASSRRERGERSKAETASFALHLKVPRWLVPRDVATLALTLNGAPLAPLPALAADGFFAIDRTWSNGDVVVLKPPMPIRTQRGVTVNNGWNNTSPKRSTAASAAPLLRRGRRAQARRDPEGEEKEQEQEQQQQQQQQQHGGRRRGRRRDRPR